MPLPMPPYSQQSFYAHSAYRSNPLPNTSGMGSPRSSLSRVQTIDSQSQMSIDLSSSPPPSDAYAPSEPDADASAVQPWRYQDPRSPQPENAQVVYPQRQTGLVGVQQYGGVYPTGPSWQPTPLQHRGTASSGFGGFGGFSFSRSDTFGSTTSSTSQKNGHRYGKVTIKGKGRVLQGNAYDGPQAPEFMRENEYGEVEVDEEGRLVQMDVRTDVVREFLNHRDQNVRREHQGDATPPQQRR